MVSEYIEYIQPTDHRSTGQIYVNTVNHQGKNDPMCQRVLGINPEIMQQKKINYL